MGERVVSSHQCLVGTATIKVTDSLQACGKVMMKRMPVTQGITPGWRSVARREVDHVGNDLVAAAQISIDDKPGVESFLTMAVDALVEALHRGDGDRLRLALHGGGLWRSGTTHGMIVICTAAAPGRGVGAAAANIVSLNFGIGWYRFFAGSVHDELARTAATGRCGG